MNDDTLDGTDADFTSELTDEALDRAESERFSSTHGSTHPVGCWGAISD